MKYTKEIEVSDTGMVIARVRDSTNRCCGLNFFNAVFGTNAGVERMCKKAHIWADERIRICKEQET